MLPYETSRGPATAAVTAGSLMKQMVAPFSILFVKAKALVLLVRGGNGFERIGSASGLSWLGVNLFVINWFVNSRKNRYVKSSYCNGV